MEISNPLDVPFTSPSISRELNQCFYQLMAGASPCEEQKKRQLLLRCGKCAAASLAFLRALTFANLSLKLPYVGIPCLIGNMSASTGSDTYYFSAMIDDLFSYQSPDEKKISLEEISKCHQIMLAFFCLPSAVCSQTPSILTALVYNEKALRIPVALINAVVGSFSPMYSMWLLEMEKLREKQAPKGADALFFTYQKNLVQLIEKNIKNFKKLSLEDKQSLIQDLQAIQNTPDSPEKISRHLAKILSIQEEINPPSQPPSQTGESVVQALALILALTFLGVKGQFTWVESKEEIVDSDIAAGFFTALYELTSFYGTKRLIEGAVLRIFHSIADRNAPATEKSLLEQLRSKEVFYLGSINYLITVFSLGVTYVIWNDFYKNEAEKIFFIAMMSLAVFCIFSRATSQMLDGMMESLLLAKGSEDEKAILSLALLLQKEKKFIKNLSIEAFKDLFSKLPEEIKIKILPALLTDTKSPLITDLVAAGSLPEDKV
jgi:hypothetical protein